MKPSHNLIRFSISIERIVFIILNIFALLNIQFLFLNIIRIENEIIGSYTKVSIFFLIFYLVTRFVSRGFNLKKLLNILPDILFIILGLSVGGSERVFQFYLLGRQTFILIRNLAFKQNKGRLFEKLSDNPPVFVLFSFLLVIFIGTLLLLLPAATSTGKITSLLGALFTSTSATCVTGLIVYDTGTHFTLFGQLIILSLIQIGGLGIMTVSSAFAIMLGQKLSLKSENLIQNVIGESNKINMVILVKGIFFVTIFFEIIGALLLYLTFKSEIWTTQKAVYHAVFHSISSFCNAGFSLYSNSFMAFRSNLNINFVITTLIIFGGIGFPVIVDLKRIIAYKFKLSRLTLHSKIVLSTTVFLILLGFIGYFISEYNSEMKGFSMLDRIYASFFQSVTTRTAGFNTIDNANLSRASVYISNIFMFIGASPGSTGGGVKTTTFAIIIISLIAIFRGNKDVSIFQRKVAEDIIKKIMALIAASLFLLSLMIFILLLLEPFPFEKVVFECFSAFGTVGLSMGITPNLSNISRIVIIILMYLGRVGPLTLIFAISETKTKTSYHFTEEKISIG